MAEIIQVARLARSILLTAVALLLSGAPACAADEFPPELVRFQKVEAGEAQWATDLLQVASKRRNIGCANQRVAESAASPHAADVEAKVVQLERQLASGSFVRFFVDPDFNRRKPHRLDHWQVPASFFPGWHLAELVPRTGIEHSPP